MSFTTYSVNDMVFVDGIGYGTLVECGKGKSIEVKESPAVIEKRQSIYFDPELFNSEADGLARQKSQSAILVPNPKSQTKIESQKKVEGQSTPSNVSQPQQSHNESKPPPKTKIVKIKLEGNSNVFVYTAESNMRKHVIIPVKPLFMPAMGILNIKIEIGKTIESFKKEILDLMGLKQAHYYNVKLFTTSPALGELSSPGKTVWQYGLRESSILTMVADHGFCFQTVPTPMAEYFAVTNNNLTFASLPRKPKMADNTVIALPPPSTTTETQTQTQTTDPQQLKAPQQKQVVQGQKKEQQKKQNTQNSPTKQQQKHAQTKQEQKNAQTPAKQVEPPQTLQVKGDKVLKSGKQYFEVRLDKLPQNPSHLKIGIWSDSGSTKWYFSPLAMQKHTIEGENIMTEAYGMTFKQNDTVGVLTKIDKHRVMRVSFFKNNVNLGVCFEGKVEEIGFVFEIGSQGQISLDTRAQLPIDSYRLR